MASKMAPTRKRNSEHPSSTAIPRFTIDLSLDPEYRYVALAKQYRPQVQRLTALFDDLLSDLGIPKGYHKTINRFAGLLLRRVHSPVETAELRGISRTARIPMYLLVSLNLVLDLLMGCTSGAVKALEKGQDPVHARMLHFRTLDWAMDPLRSVVVQLDFIRSKDQNGTHILGSSITYVGFVGVLTGVRERLSLSLNFRPTHNASTKAHHFRFYFHHILVLLGLRPSISSILRSCLFGNDSDWSQNPRTLDEILNTVPQKHTTAAYLIFCDGALGISMEKDFRTAVVHQARNFIVTTNNDLDYHAGRRESIPPNTHTAALQELLDESEDRRDCVVQKWQTKLRREWRRRQRIAEHYRDAASEGTLRRQSLRSSKQSLGQLDSTDMNDIERDMSVTIDELARWTSSFPTTNELTQYAAILDPGRGKGEVVWSRRYLKPIEIPLESTPRIELNHYLEIT
jgi:beta subunit of N-acylethanolamine-hydrolyzing acid amidase